MHMYLDALKHKHIVNYGRISVVMKAIGLGVCIIYISYRCSWERATYNANDWKSNSQTHIKCNTAHLRCIHKRSTIMRKFVNLFILSLSLRIAVSPNFLYSFSI